MTAHALGVFNLSKNRRGKAGKAVLNLRGLGNAGEWIGFQAAGKRSSWRLQGMKAETSSGRPSRSSGMFGFVSTWDPGVYAYSESVGVFADYHEASSPRPSEAPASAPTPAAAGLGLLGLGVLLNRRRRR